jgi:Homeodomain-like domain
MKPPIYVRQLSDAEHKAVEAGLRSPNAFVLRRCQMLLASARGERVPAIARALSCNEQTVRNAIHAFNHEGLAALQEGQRIAFSLLLASISDLFKRPIQGGRVDGQRLGYHFLPTIKYAKVHLRHFSLSLGVF